MALPTGSTLGPMLVLFLILGLRVLLRKQWIAVLIAGLLFVRTATIGEAPVVEIGFAVVSIAIQIYVLMRLGLAALIATATFANVVSYFPLTASPSDWYVGTSVAALLFPLVFAIYGLLTSTGRLRGGRSERLLD
jgi:hypothetical protein